MRLMCNSLMANGFCFKRQKNAFNARYAAQCFVEGISIIIVCFCLVGIERWATGLLKGFEEGTIGL